MPDSTTRRFFIGATTALAATRVWGANDKINVAIVGLGGRGSNHLNIYSHLPDVRVAGLCDVDQSALERAQATLLKNTSEKAKEFDDMRKVFADPSIEAVSIATPNHWHALAAIWAMKAGKDVYGEKPAAYNIYEGQRMIQTLHETNRVMQVGSQHRSTPFKMKGIDALKGGLIGNIYMAKGLCFKRRASIGHENDSPTPPGVDWDMFLGPAPMRAFNKLRFKYNWHWFWDTGNGDIGNQGVHEMGICRWGLGDPQWPKTAYAQGGKYAYTDDQETPNTLLANFDYGGREIVFEVRGLLTNSEGAAPPARRPGPPAAGAAAPPTSSAPLATAPKIGAPLNLMTGDLFYGTEGWAAMGDAGFQAFKGESNEVIMDERPERGADATGLHMQNFLAACRSRKQADLHDGLENAVQSAGLCHLANISYRTGRKLTLEPGPKFVGRCGGKQDVNAASVSEALRGLKREVALRVLSLTILAFQIYIPWSVKHLVTQDGPAHVYTAFVAKDLIFHRHTSPYHELYRVQKTPLPNWTCTILLAGILSVFGPDYAEAILMTVCLLVGYGSLAYCMGSLSQRGPPLLFANWLIQSWFLWAGFYNFYLGMMLMPLVIGIYLRHRDKFAILSGSLLLLFFTHLVPAALALLVLGIIGVWTKRGWKLAVALAPTAILVGVYALNFKRDTQYQPDILLALQKFPQKIFVFSSGWIGEQRYLWVAILLVILLAVFLMSRQEWKGPLGALVTAILCAFLLYLFAPDVGFGGSVVKMRFAFAVFLFGTLLIGSVERLRHWAPWIGAVISMALLAQLIDVARQVRVTSDGVEEYLAAMDKLPIGARFVRMYFPAPLHLSRFQLHRLDLLPLLHVDELGAVRRHAVAMSDYQSATGTFAVDIKPSVDDGHRHSLGFETPGDDAWASIPWLNGGLPVTIDYVVYFGDQGPGSEAPVKYIGGNSAVRIYRLAKRQP